MTVHQVSGVIAASSGSTNPPPEPTEDKPEATQAPTGGN